MTRSAIVLVSGGLDSATCLAIAKSEGFECYALSIDYGQRHQIELKAAANVVKSIGAIARENRLKFHLDGARVFNGLVETGYGYKDYANNFDSVSI